MRSNDCTAHMLPPTCRSPRGALVRSSTLLALAVAAACATGRATDSAPGSAPAVSATATSRGMLDVLTGEEMRRHSDASASLYDQVRVLRVGFLQQRDGAEPTVFIDGRYAGPSAVLHDIPVRSVREIRLLRGGEIPLLLGQQHRYAVVLHVILLRDAPHPEGNYQSHIERLLERKGPDAD
jgi:hypothetical protein